ncbi:hypothetical protein DFH06DRAFT_1324342 [Mycena polygramma]|nr:hypothetical protein DFH06DRAFT_1324342 [Mycena polygramma]
MSSESTDLAYLPHDACSYNWDTSFPERYLSHAIRVLHYNNYPTPASRTEPDLGLLIGLVYMLRQYFVHFGVPEDEVDARFEAMGMGALWKEIEPGMCPELLEGIPVRKPEEPLPAKFRFSKYSSFPIPPNSLEN